MGSEVQGSEFTSNQHRNKKPGPIALQPADQFKNMMEQSDTANPQSLRGVGPYGPSGPEAKIQNSKFSQKAGYA